MGRLCSLIGPASARKAHIGATRQDQSALTLLAVRDDYVCGSDGKTVAAHGLRDVRGVLNVNGAGWTARKESGCSVPVCPL